MRQGWSAARNKAPRPDSGRLSGRGAKYFLAPEPQDAIIGIKEAAHARFPDAANIQPCQMRESMIYCQVQPVKKPRSAKSGKKDERSAMAEKDLAGKKAGDYNDVFAGIYNTLLFGNMTDKKWNKAKSIHEMLDMDAELAKHVQDYKIPVFDIAYLDDGIIESFRSDFREDARLFKKKRLGEDPFASKNALKHPHAIMEFISVFTRDGSNMNMEYLEDVIKTGGDVTMCAVAEALKTEGRKEGRKQGRLEGRKEGRLEGGVAA